MPQANAYRNNLRILRRELPPPPRRKPPAVRKLLVMALAIIGLLVVVAAVYRSIPVTYETVVLTRGSVEVMYAADGVVVRQERVYTAPAAGQLKRLVPEGQRVRVGSPIAQISAGGAATAAPAAPAAAPTAPAAGPTAPAARDDSAVRREIDRLSDAIYQKAVQANQARADGDTATANRLQDELDELSLRQQQLTQQLGRSEPSIIAPPARAPEPPAGPVLGTITASVSGVVIYQTDGLEDRLAAARSKEWKPSLLRSLNTDVRTTGESVGKGDAVLKVVDNLSLSLLAVVPEAALSRLGDTDRVTIRFAGRDGEVTARITRQVKEGGDVLLVLTAPALPEELIVQRRFRATLVLGTYEGLVMPRTALDVRNGLQGVWVLEATETRFHPVRVLGGTDDLLALETDLPVGVRVLKNAPTGMH